MLRGQKVYMKEPSVLTHKFLFLNNFEIFLKEEGSRLLVL